MALIDKASLLMVPSVYEDGTLYNVLPSGNKAPDETGNNNGYDQTRADFTFSRGSNLTATRVNANGLIEKGRENLLLQSNAFDTTWVNNNTIETGGQTDKDGGTNAWKLEINGGTLNQRIEQNQSTSGVQTFSVYAKAGTLDWMYIRIDGSGGLHTAYFDLSTGSVGTTALLIDSNIEAAGNGFYRCSVTFSDTITITRIYLATANGNTTQSSGNIYIQNAQLEYGLTASSYLDSGATTATAGVLENTPRIDYSSGAGALLLEPQRTNLIDQSEYYNTYWSTTSNLSITDNYATSPEGYKNASRWVSTGGSFPQMTRSISGLTIGTTYTASFYVKSDGTNQIQQTIWFTGFDGTTFTPGNDWTRITNTFTATATSHTFVLFTNSGAAAASSFLLYGIQLESGSHVSSYVPTYGSAATRGADFSSDDDLTANPIAFGANDDFTLFYEGSFDDLSSTSNMIMGGGRQQLGNSYKNYWWVQNATSMRITGDAEVRLATTSMSLTDNTNHKLLVKRSGSVVDFFVDGTKLTTTQNNPNTAFTFRSLGWAYTNSVYKVSGNMKKAIVFDTALTDAECVTLTTL